MEIYFSKYPKIYSRYLNIRGCSGSGGMVVGFTTT